MKNKNLLLIAISLLFLKINVIAQTLKIDSLKKATLSIRCAGGISLFNSGEYNKDKELYDLKFKTVDGYTSQIGIKLTNIPKKAISFTAEANYLVSKFYIEYRGYKESIGSQTNIFGNYSTLLHSVQLVFMPKITIGKKKIIYTAFGLYVTLPIYQTAKGSLIVNNWNISGLTTTANYNNEIKTNFSTDLGAIYSVGLDLPIKNKKIGIELRLQPCLNNTVIKPYIKIYSALLSINYQFVKF